MFEKEILELAKKRESVASLQIQVDDLRQQWEMQHQATLAKLALDKRALAELDHDLRLKVVKHYLDTGDKKSHPALGIRLSQDLSYDPGDIRRWIVEHPEHNWLLVLDTKAFKGYIKGLTPQAFHGLGLDKHVVFKDKVIATISKNLEEKHE